jgi:hypothetical protein
MGSYDPWGTGRYRGVDLEDAEKQAQAAGDQAWILHVTVQHFTVTACNLHTVTACDPWFNRLCKMAVLDHPAS